MLKPLCGAAERAGESEFLQLCAICRDCGCAGMFAHGEGWVLTEAGMEPSLCFSSVWWPWVRQGRGRHDQRHAGQKGHELGLICRW